MTRPAYCCGKCPEVEGGGYDCTCRGNPRCSKPITAADCLRLALKDAPPGLHVARSSDHSGLSLLTADGDLWIEGDVWATLRLIGLLLAAAPHLADVLEDPCGEGPSWPEVNLRRAITEAAQAMEPSDEPTTGD